MKTLIVIISLFLLATTSVAEITIHGKVTDANGKAPILAHVHFGTYSEGTKHSHTTACSKDGSFSITAEKEGVYLLRVSAVDHSEISMPLILSDHRHDVEINVRLKANPMVEHPDHITIIGDWNKFEFASNDTLTAVHRGDGSVVYSTVRPATGDTMSYQLLGTTESGHSINGSQADYYTYDGGGDYRSVIKTAAGHSVTITYDPSARRYPNDSNLPKVSSNDPTLTSLFTFSSTFDRMKDASLTPLPTGQMKLDTAKLAELKNYTREYIRHSETSNDMTVAQFAAIELSTQNFFSAQLSRSDAELIMHTVSATSPLWAINPSGASGVASQADSIEGAAYFAAMANNPEPSVRVVALGKKLEDAFGAKNMNEARAIYTDLKEHYSDVSMTRYLLMQYNPDAVVQVGKTVPTFEVDLLDGSGKVSDASMKGKYYMIDFWATWCGPCVGEMPSIHKAYEKFKGKKGFEILSLSMDAAASQISPFRAKKWKMPWLHAFIPGVFEAEVAKRFEVASIPKPILVGPDGKIIAMEEELRGDNLEKTLGKFLGETN